MGINRSIAPTHPGISCKIAKSLILLLQLLSAPSFVSAMLTIGKGDILRWILCIAGQCIWVWSVQWDWKEHSAGQCIIAGRCIGVWSVHFPAMHYNVLCSATNLEFDRLCTGIGWSTVHCIIALYCMKVHWSLIGCALGLEGAVQRRRNHWPQFPRSQRGEVQKLRQIKKVPKIFKNCTILGKSYFPIIYIKSWLKCNAT